MENKISKVEIEKENSNFLRGTLKEQLAQETSHFDDTIHNVLKSHGIYEQDDRDVRQELKGAGKEKRYSCMIRTKIPGGKLTWEQYLVMDELSDRYGNQSLRITTRQGIQFHGVIKKDLRPTLRKLNEALVTTLGGCGDIGRNVVTCPAPHLDRTRAQVQEYARLISDDLLPKTKAYHEIWLNGEKVHTTEQEVEPLYGKTYLPRKFKISIAFPGDNCVDIYAHDIGLVAVLDNGNLAGFNVLVGGGLAMTHTRPETRPLLAKSLGYINREKIIPVVEAIVKVQRDFGNRENRSQARMKYLIEERGVEWFYQEVKKHTRFDLEPIREMKWDQTEDHLGWQEMGTRLFFFGLFVENGRIRDVGNLRMKTGLRKIVEIFKPEIRLSPQQNILIAGISSTQKAAFEDLLKEYGIRKETEITNVERWSMACPALPTCGLAITEGERVFPGIIDELEKMVSQLGLQDEKITVRLTGCPNGCARPYTSEIGLVGIGILTYKLFVGGNFEGTRLNQMLVEKVKERDIVKTLLPLLETFKRERKPAERFGDFCYHKGLDALKSLLPGV